MKRYINGKAYYIDIEVISLWHYKITVYEYKGNKPYYFIGKAISNDIEYAISEILRTV